MKGREPQRTGGGLPIPSVGDRLPQPLGKLPPQPWLTAADTQAVLAALSASGAEVRFIGGCVRDALQGRPVRDIDLALARNPDEVMALLRRAGIRAIPTGIDHGTVTAIMDHHQFEITTLRVDVETDGRRAKVAFTDDWVADAARRDFTINALSCTASGDVYDYFGGIEDLHRGVVRFVGNARERIVEDALRIMRFFRFYGDYGRPPADEEALSACRELAARVRSLSGERVRGELLRILAGVDPAGVLQLMREAEVLAEVLPEAGALGRLRALCWLETHALAADSIVPDQTRRLAAVLDTDAAGAARVAERLKFSNRERDRLVAAVARRWPVVAGGDAIALKRALHHLGAVRARDAALLAWAREVDEIGRLPRERTVAWRAILDGIDAWQPRRFPLRGRDALALGLASGPRVGEVLARVEAWWEAGGFVADREACLDRLRQEARRADGSAASGAGISPTG